jgi:rRNA maturation RNase YbeY
MLKVNFLVEPHYSLDRKLVRAAAQKVATFVNLKSEAEITVSIIGDRKMKQLNHRFRGKDTTTNVLSFTATEAGTAPGFKTPVDNVLYIGDVVVSYPVAMEEAIKENEIIDERVAFLVSHGLLHLFGYDHEKDLEAKEMEAIEDQIMLEIKAPAIIK